MLRRWQRHDALNTRDAYALDDLTTEGKFIAGSQGELAPWHIGVVVREGEVKADIRSAESLKQILPNSTLIACSDSASGVCVQNELFKRLGIEDQVKRNAKMTPRIPVASVLANGQYEVGFQQVSELLPVKDAALSVRSLSISSQSRGPLLEYRCYRRIRRKRGHCCTIFLRPKSSP